MPRKEYCHGDKDVYRFVITSGVINALGDLLDSGDTDILLDGETDTDSEGGDSLELADTLLLANTDGDMLVLKQDVDGVALKSELVDADGDTVEEADGDGVGRMQEVMTTSPSAPLAESLEPPPT